MTQPNTELFTDANLSDDSAAATADSLPGYGPTSDIPGAKPGPSEPVQGTDFDPQLDSITTEPEATQLNASTDANEALPADLMKGLRERVQAADQKAQQNATAQPSPAAGFSPLAPQGQRPPPPLGPQTGGQQGPPINEVTPAAMSGYVAASLTYVDDSLISALQSAAATSGPHAALMASTVTRVAPNAVAAGGEAPVGSRGTPASTLIYGSQGGQGNFGRNIAWFFPTINAWAAEHPPPLANPQGQPGQQPQTGELPMEGSP